MKPLLKVDNLECRFGDHSVVDRLSLDLARGEICCLLGPSGCGKTTLLHALAGFMPLHQGRIELEGQCIARPEDSLPPEHRGIGMVFQDYALFPHLTVAANIGFGLKALGASKRAARTQEALALVHMEALADRYPHELSGGQQQRVALARALAPKPRLLLMDEPFSNLDTELRRALSAEVRDILKAAGMTAIMVTHDRDEAFVVSDRLGVLDQGRLQQWDTPEVVYHQPANATVASFVGDGVFIGGVAKEDGVLETELGALAAGEDAWPAGTHLDVFIRPDEVHITDDAKAMPARIVGKAFLGTQTRYRFRLPSGRVINAILSSSRRYQLGDTVRVNYRTLKPIAFPASTRHDPSAWRQHSKINTNYAEPRAVNL